MYMPSHFAVSDRRTQLDFIRQTGWGYLTGIVGGEPFVTHLPFLLEGPDGNEKLVAHMARANPHWESFAAGTPQLVVFPGPHAYVSPQWYQSKKAVPTWNYAAAHVYGRPRIIDDPEQIIGAQKRLVDHYESDFDQPWQMEDVDPDFIDGMLRAIVNFEIAVERIECKFKLSQNRPDADRERVQAALGDSPNSGARAVAALMAATDRADR